MIKTNYLSKYKKNYTSQYGEDGIIEEILLRLDIKTGTAVDVGANDGKWYSNTFTLLQRGFTVYAIERSNKARQLTILKNTYPNLHPLQIAVCLDKNSDGHINNILKNMGVPNEIDVISIDIDSIDAWVFEDLDRNPKLVVIELESRYYPLDAKWHNPTGTRETNPPQNLTGFYPTYTIAKKKGYRFIAHTASNIFFLREDLVEKLNMPEVTAVHELSNFDPVRLSALDKQRWEKYIA